MNAQYVWIDGVAFSPKHPKVKALNENRNHSSVPHTEPERNQTPALGNTVSGKENSVGRTRIRFTGYRVRPLDPDNFAGSVKDLLDGLRHAQLIHGDEPWRIILETDQVKVDTFAQEKTVITIETP